MAARANFIIPCSIIHQHLHSINHPAVWVGVELQEGPPGQCTGPPSLAITYTHTRTHTGTHVTYSSGQYWLEQLDQCAKMHQMICNSVFVSDLGMQAWTFSVLTQSHWFGERKIIMVMGCKKGWTQKEAESCCFKAWIENCLHGTASSAPPQGIRLPSIHLNTTHTHTQNMHPHRLEELWNWTVTRLQWRSSRGC